MVQSTWNRDRLRLIGISATVLVAAVALAACAGPNLHIDGEALDSMRTVVGDGGVIPPTIDQVADPKVAADYLAYLYNDTQQMLNKIDEMQAKIQDWRVHNAVSYGQDDSLNAFNADVQRYEDKLRAALDRVKVAIAAGANPSEVAALYREVEQLQDNVQAVDNGMPRYFGIDDYVRRSVNLNSSNRGILRGN